ncbi:MAG: putative toxin-antitoxin system toxin component, PIN family [Elusimicrobia bacterium CG1_02_37_114]|nr:MAG: putative toxin-antitoxin system toxin component, PIN family [Elusimicrobia bacterium CG1_02_37_114]PIV53470.1 MAG: putative toxin-antitoxin system toxin component, PIN family [Elusimicrobia bacterium CG02_land_8_20_14_3_00_37_13]PIZ12458.1 MAG: putative toxin-antitoxin system toxin component, PIN family [Elusimicrobia bacterium CG_4_10_14_0_8_um_filter_37_32]
MTKIPRVVIDTNIFVSALLGSKNCLTIRKSFLNGIFDIIISKALFDELIDVISRPKFNKIIEQQDIKEIAELLKTDADWVSPQEKILVCRDPKDNPVLECAVAGKVNFIVAGDKDLLELKTFRGISILTPQKFLKFIKIGTHPI